MIDKRIKHLVRQHFVPLFFLCLPWIGISPPTLALDGLPFDVRSLGLAVQPFAIRDMLGSDVLTAFSVSEGEEQVDLNGDGDTEDFIVHVYDADRRILWNTRLTGEAVRLVSGRWVVVAEFFERNRVTTFDTWLEREQPLEPPVYYWPVAATQHWLVSPYFEEQWGDLNGDGDTLDTHLLVHDLETGQGRILPPPVDGNFWLHTSVTDRWLCVGDLVVDLSNDAVFPAGGHVEATLKGQALVQVTEIAEDLNGNGVIGDTVLHVLDLESRTLRNLGVAGTLVGDRMADTGQIEPLAWTEGKAYVYVDESLSRQDANGDGDTLDYVIMSLDLDVEPIALKLVASGDPLLRPSEQGAGCGFGCDPSLLVEGRWLAYLTLRQEDSNGDGNVNVSFTDVNVYDLLTATRVNLGPQTHAGDNGWSAFFSFGTWIEFQREESQARIDINHDGDFDDWGLVLHDVKTGRELSVPCDMCYGILPMSGNWLLQSGGWEGTIEALNLTDGKVVSDQSFSGELFVALGTNRIPKAVFLALRESEGRDLNGDGDFDDAVLHLVLESETAVVAFHRADPNSSGTTDMSDAIAIFGYLFLGSETPSCLESADVQNDGKIDISDGIAILQYLFSNGPSPAAPGTPVEPCGVDTDLPGSARDLGCQEYAPCA